MFRLEVNHLQALTTFSLPDALPTIPCNKPERDTGCKTKPYQIDVPQHQPQHDNGTHS